MLDWVHIPGQPYLREAENETQRTLADKAGKRQKSEKINMAKTTNTKKFLFLLTDPAQRSECRSGHLNWRIETGEKTDEYARVGIGNGTKVHGERSE
jgi:hypothetical protein